jgi:hypothetical protein
VANQAVTAQTNQSLTDVLSAITRAVVVAARDATSWSDAFAEQQSQPFAYRIPKVTVKVGMSFQQVTQDSLIVRLFSSSSESKSDLNSSIEFDIVAVPRSAPLAPAGQQSQG